MTKTLFESRSPSQQIAPDQSLNRQAIRRFRQNVSGTDTDSDNRVLKTIDRFWEKVERGAPNECWLWTAGKFAQGYGAFVYGKYAPGYAHRFAYELSNGPIPVGMVVMHRCDNPACTNPSHLTLGTQKQNVRDAVAKGRWMTEGRERHLDSVKEWERDQNGLWSPTKDSAHE